MMMRQTDGVEVNMSNEVRRTEARLLNEVLFDDR